MTSPDKGPGGDLAEWSLQGPNGLLIPLRNVVFSREMAEVPDCDDPNLIRREYGAATVSAVIDTGQPPA